MKTLPPNNFRSPAQRVYAHLTDEERLDIAAELLAKGVMRLAEKRGLLKCLEKACPLHAPKKGQVSHDE